MPLIDNRFPYHYRNTVKIGCRIIKMSKCIRFVESSETLYVIDVDSYELL